MGGGRWAGHAGQLRDFARQAWRWSPGTPDPAMLSAGASFPAEIGRLAPGPPRWLGKGESAGPDPRAVHVHPCPGLPGRALRALNR